MSPRTFLAWLVVTVATVVAAVVVTLDRPGVTSVRLENEPAFPKLRDDPDAVAAVEVSGGGESFTLTRGEGGAWSAPEKHGYPVSAEQVRKLIVTLSDMRLVEAKTAREDRLGRLDLEDPEGVGAKSRLLRLTGADGEVIAEVVVGKGLSRATGRVEGGTYIRRPGETQAWLASGRIEPGESLDKWLDSTVVHMASNSVRLVEVEPLEGQPIRLERPEPDGDFTLAELPEGRQVNPSKASRLVSGLAFLNFDDVVPRDELDLGVVSRHAVYTDFDGLQVTVDIVPVEGDKWALFQAGAVPVEDQEEETHKAIEAKAAAIAKRVGGWAYKLPDYAIERLELSFDDLHMAAIGS